MKVAKAMDCSRKSMIHIILHKWLFFLSKTNQIQIINRKKFPLNEFLLNVNKCLTIGWKLNLLQIKLKLLKSLKLLQIHSIVNDWNVRFISCFAVKNCLIRAFHFFMFCFPESLFESLILIVFFVLMATIFRLWVSCRWLVYLSNLYFYFLLFIFLRVHSKKD